jgi:hypothetical protein
MVNPMPLSLRRRPRLAPAEPEAHDDVPQPVAAEAAPTAPTATPTRRARRRRMRSDDWLGRFLGEAFFFLVGLTAWLINAIFTILGVTAALGTSPGSAKWSNRY